MNASSPKVPVETESCSKPGAVVENPLFILSAINCPWREGMTITMFHNSYKYKFPCSVQSIRLFPHVSVLFQRWFYRSVKFWQSHPAVNGKEKTSPSCWDPQRPHTDPAVRAPSRSQNTQQPSWGQCPNREQNQSTSSNPQLPELPGPGLAVGTARSQHRPPGCPRDKHPAAGDPAPLGPSKMPPWTCL